MNNFESFPSSKNNDALTELRNPRSVDIDMLTTYDLVKLMNEEDQKVAVAVSNQLKKISSAIELISERMKSGGRLIYVGAGTSGRLGVLDASECPPTFNASPELVLGIIAGGREALTRSIEGAEDDEKSGSDAILANHITTVDSVVGIAASGNTPFVVGALKTAGLAGALTISIACNSPCLIESIANISIGVVVGPEILTGSTRLKAGTAQKMVLNMLSTGVMIRLGKTYGNLMVDVQATNTKLKKRAIRIVSQACNISEIEAKNVLETCNGEVKTAIVSVLNRVNVEAARKQLDIAGGIVRKALKE